MKEIFRDYLFDKGYLVAEDSNRDFHYSDTEIVCMLVALGRKCGIRIRKGARLLTKDLVKYAVNRCFVYVPEPFYRGFPETVRQLTDDERLFDQLLGYAKTYGLDSFPGEGVHSEFEDEFVRTAFKEDYDPRDVSVIPESLARQLIRAAVDDLYASPRPLNPQQILMLAEYYGENHYVPERIGCKITAIDLLLATDGYQFAAKLDLPDVIKLLERIQYLHYVSEKTNKLNLKNKDRKLLAKVISILTAKAERDHDVDRMLAACFEKRETWKGLLHHLHYKPKGMAEAYVVGSLRNDWKNRSAYAVSEGFMSRGNPAECARSLRELKGPSAVMRNLNYILSRCATEKDVEEVLKCLD